MKRLENNYIYSLAEVKRNIKELQEKPDTQSKAYQLQFQKQLEKQLNDILGRLQSKNYTTLTDYMNECYSQGYLGAMYDIAGQGIPIVSPIDEKLVVKACGKTSDDIKLINKLGTNKKLLKNQVLAEMQRGFSTSMTYSDIARNISARGKADMNRSKLIARTEGHRIQNESKLDAMIEAKKKGADVVKQWDSTMDGNTRPEHKELDGQIREVEEPFEVAGMKAQCPGGFGNAYMDCNCRCVMLERARWALDEDELEELQKRAEFFGLDKTADFEEFKAKYLNACENADTISKEKYLSASDRADKVNWNKVASSTDREQFERYKKALGKNAPKTLADFCKIKYNVNDEWYMFKTYTKAIKSGELTPLASFDLYKNTSKQIDNRLLGIVTINGITITGKSNHFIARIIGSIEQRRNGVSVDKVLSVLTNKNSEILPIRNLSNGKSQKFRNEFIEVSINPDTGNLIQVNPRIRRRSK